MVLWGTGFKRRVIQSTPNCTFDALKNHLNICWENSKYIFYYNYIISNVILYNYIFYNNYQCDFLADLLKVCNELVRKLKLPLQITEEREALTFCLTCSLDSYIS